MIGKVNTEDEVRALNPILLPLANLQINLSKYDPFIEESVLKEK